MFLHVALTNAMTRIKSIDINTILTVFGSAKNKASATKSGTQIISVHNAISKEQTPVRPGGGPKVSNHQRTRCY